MELRALLCWASLAAALEGEFPSGHPAVSGAPKVGPRAGGADLSLYLPGAPGPQTLRTNSAGAGGGGEEAARRGVEFSFVWERDGVELRPGHSPTPGSPNSYS